MFACHDVHTALLFSPVEMDDMVLVDGGMLNNFPVKEVKGKGADLVIGVQLNRI
ncbi:MAG: hypothetical protein R2788_24635 [Saprospiraceae bacterium]